MKTDSAKSTYDHVLKYTGLFGGVQGLTLLMNIVRTKIVAILLGPAGLGIISIYNSIANLLHQSTNFGISFSGVQHMAELSESGDQQAIADYARTIRTWSVLAGLLAIFVCCTLSWQISLWTFKDYDHTLHICLISPMAALMTVTGGELAILKGLKRLKRLALTTVLGALACLLICIPIYSIFGLSGIIPSLVLCQMGILAVTLSISAKVVPWQISLCDGRTLSGGKPMLKLGLGYIIAGIFGQGAEYIIRAGIMHESGEAFVGLYQCGYALMVSYVSIVFVAFEADFFPRLSAASKDMGRANHIINQQIEVGVLLIAPILIFYVMAMPLVVRVLYSEEFLAAVPMTICAIAYMFFKALTTPVAFLPLAKGDSKMYMLTELIYDVFIAIAIPLAFTHYGLMGAGCLISCAGLFYLLLIHLLYRATYGYRFSPRLLHVYLLQFILLAATVASALLAPTALKWTVGGVAFLVSACVSLRILQRETTIISTIIAKLKKRRP